MTHQGFNKIKYLTALATTFVYVVFANMRVAFAALNCLIPPDDAPHPLALVCIVARIVNVLLLSSGAVFVIVIIYGGIKLSIAQGDPKALEAGKDTLTQGVIGFLVILFLFALLYIGGNLLGVTGTGITPGWALDTLSENICKFLFFGGIKCSAGP